MVLFVFYLEGGWWEGKGFGCGMGGWLEMERGRTGRQG